MKAKDYIIRVEELKDYHETENVIREAFWNVYQPGCSEHYIVHTYRKRPDFVRELSLVMECEGRIIGHIMFAHAKIRTVSGEDIFIMTFGPLSILPSYQRRGYGLRLLNYALQKARDYGVPAVGITGNLSFYRHAGFVLGKDVNIKYHADPTADYFLVKELTPGFLSSVQGTYFDPDGYDVSLEEVDAYDANFPHKEKRVLPGQLFK